MCENRVARPESAKGVGGGRSARPSRTQGVPPDPPTCTKFLRKVHTALKPGGRAAILEFVPNPDRVTPPTAAAFSLIMLAFTPSGDAYTFRELESMAREAGFSRVELSPTDVGVEQLVVAQK